MADARWRVLNYAGGQHCVSLCVRVSLLVGLVRKHRHPRALDGAAGDAPRPEGRDRRYVGIGATPTHIIRVVQRDATAWWWGRGTGVKVPGSRRHLPCSRVGVPHTVPGVKLPMCDWLHPLRNTLVHRVSATPWEHTGPWELESTVAIMGLRENGIRTHVGMERVASCCATTVAPSPVLLLEPVLFSLRTLRNHLLRELMGSVWTACTTHA